MKEFLKAVVADIPNNDRAEFEAEVKQLLKRTRQKLLGEVQTMLAAYNVSRQADLDLLRKEIDRIFLEDEDVL